MKRNKKIAVWSGVLAGISLAAFGVSRYEEQKEIIKNSDAVIMEVEGNEVKALSWECDTGFFGFYRNEEGIWTYDEDEEFPVDEEKMEELLEEFEALGVSFVIEEVEDLGQYGLDAPVCTIHMKTEMEDYEILLGNFSTMDSERYVSIGDGNVYLVKKDPLETYGIEIRDLIKHDEVPKLEKVMQLKISGAESEKIIYEEDSSKSYYEGDVYFLEQGETYLPLDTNRVSRYLNIIQNLNLRDYVNYHVSKEDLVTYGLDSPECSITIDYTKVDEETGEEQKEVFVLNIARDPKEQKEVKKEAEKKKNQEGTREETQEEIREDTEEDEITAYARVGESGIIYQISSGEYRELTEGDYDALRHHELFWADFGDMYQLDIRLEGNSYTITADKEDAEKIFKYQDAEISFAEIQSAVEGLKAERFMDETPDGKEEISLTIHMDNENYPEISIQLYRCDGKNCIAVVDGKPVAYVSRNHVVDLIEAVYGVVLK